MSYYSPEQRAADDAVTAVFSSHIFEIGDQSDSLHALVYQAGPGMKIPTCPGWTMRDLLSHVGRMLVWVNKVCLAGASRPLPEMGKAPDDFEEMIAWYGYATNTLIKTLSYTGPFEQCAPLRGREPGNVGFWARRIAHECAIHRLDALLGLHGDIGPMYDHQFAADGIDEFFFTLYPLFADKRPPVTATGTISLAALNVGRTWLIQFRPGEQPQIRTTDRESDPIADYPADLTLESSSDTLYRVIWGRSDNVFHQGDLSLLEHISAP